MSVGHLQIKEGHGPCGQAGDAKTYNRRVARPTHDRSPGRKSHTVFVYYPMQQVPNGMPRIDRCIRAVEVKNEVENWHEGP